jgi:hypothetical protein
METRTARSLILGPLCFLVLFHILFFRNNEYASIFLYVVIPLILYITLVLIVIPFFSHKEVTLAYQYGVTHGINFGAAHIVAIVTLVFGGVSFFFYQHQDLVPFSLVWPKLLGSYFVTVLFLLFIMFFGGRGNIKR